MKTIQNFLCKHVLLFTFYSVYRKEGMFQGFQSEIAIISVTKIKLYLRQKTKPSLSVKRCARYVRGEWLMGKSWFLVMLSNAIHLLYALGDWCAITCYKNVAFWSMNGPNSRPLRNDEKTHTHAEAEQEPLFHIALRSSKLATTSPCSVLLYTANWI